MLLIRITPFFYLNAVALFFFLVLFGYSKVYSQFPGSKVPVKSNLIYLFEKKELNGEDVKIDKRSEFIVTLDSVIYLKGNDRRLIVFSKSLNTVLLNEGVSIITKSKVEPSDIFHLEGIPFIYPGLKDNSDEQATIVYQIKTATYLLTVPRNFFVQNLRNRFFINELDESLQHSILDSSLYGIYDLKSYLSVNNMFVPLNRFAIIKGGKEDTKLVFGKNDYLFSFLRYTKEDGEKPIPFSPVELYTSIPDNPLFGHEIKLSVKFGIIEAFSHFENRHTGITYETNLKLQKIEPPPQ